MRSLRHPHRAAANGIDAPAQVAEGSHGPVEVTATGASEITVHVSSTGETIDVPVDSNGKAQFELPSGASAGDVITIIDADDPSVSTTMNVVPASI